MRGFALHLRQCHAMQCNASRAVKHFHSVGPTVQDFSRSPDSVSITQWVCGAQVLPCNRQESPLPKATVSSVCREAAQDTRAQDTVSPPDHSGRVKLVLQAENATLVCPRTFSCLGSWPTPLRNLSEASPITPEVKVFLVSPELSGQYRHAQIHTSDYNALHLARSQAGGLSYLHEAILKGSGAACMGRCLSMSDS